jgi:hypothetical protein
LTKNLASPILAQSMTRISTALNRTELPREARQASARRYTPEVDA